MCFIQELNGPMEDRILRTGLIISTIGRIVAWFPPKDACMMASGTMKDSLNVVTFSSL